MWHVAEWLNLSGEYLEAKHKRQNLSGVAIGKKLKCMLVTSGGHILLVKDSFVCTINIRSFKLISNSFLLILK